jgi:hypothetical protein
MPAPIAHYDRFDQRDLRRVANRCDREGPENTWSRRSVCVSNCILCKARHAAEHFDIVQDFEVPSLPCDQVTQ